jgi:hypothetical protein
MGSPTPWRRLAPAPAPTRWVHPPCGGSTPPVSTMGWVHLPRGGFPARSPGGEPPTRWVNPSREWGQESEGVGGGSVDAGFHGGAVEEFVFRGGFAALLHVHWPTAGFGGCPGHHNPGVRAGVGGGRGARCIVMAWGSGQVPGPRGAAVVPFFGGAIVGTQAASRMPVASRSAPIGAARVIARERLRPERPVPVWSLWTTFCAFGLLRGSCPDAAC